MSGSKQSFFSITTTSGSQQKPGSQGGTPRRNASSSNLSRGSGSSHKPEWQGTYESESAPTSRRASFSDDSGELGAKTPPLTPPLMRLTRVKVEDRVKVVVRLRPAQTHETPGAVQVAEDGQHVRLERTKAMIPSTEFKFDQVLRQESTQGDVYAAAVEPVVADVLKGYNGTVMAYGQTGAGKTFTLSSLAPNNIGMMPRAAAAIFNGIKADPSHHYTVHMSYMQIYMELIQDLLQPKSTDLQVRETAEDGVHVAGLKEVLVTRLEDCLELLKLGERNRMYAFTKMNAHSSRSHALVLLTVAKRRVIAGAGGAAPSADNVSMKANIGRLYMVDLAGSERLKKSLSTGVRASEAKAINLSLTVLGMCINSRASANSTHAPYRDSKLTRILKESLGGNARTTLVVAIAEAMEHADETLQSLQFGTRAMFVENAAVVNEKTDDAVTHQQLLLEMAEQADRADTLSRSLIDKESALGDLERKLEDERKANESIMDALEKERQQALAAQQRAMEQHLAELEAERQHQADLAAQLSQTQAETQQLASKHKEEQARLMADLEARTAALTETQATVAEREAAHAQLQQHCKELQERLREELEGASKRSAAEVAELESRLEQSARELADVSTAAAAAADKAAADMRSIQEQLVQQANVAAAELKSAREAAAAELDRVRQEAAQAASAAAAKLESAKQAAAAEVERVRQEVGQNADASLRSAQQAAAAELDRVRKEAAQQLADARQQAKAARAALDEQHAAEMQRLQGEHEAEVVQLAEQIIQLEAKLQQAAADAERRASEAQALQQRLQQQEEEAKAAAAQAEEEFDALRSAADAEAQELHRQVEDTRREADAAATRAAEDAEQLRLEARQASADHRAQVDQLLKHVELLRNEAELAKAEHEQRLSEARAQAKSAAAAAEQREAKLQADADAAAQQHSAVAGHLREIVTSLEAKLQEQRELTDSYVESHRKEVADLRRQLEQSQMVADAMAAEMADLRHMAAEVEAERDEAAEEVARLGGELHRLQQEWASDSAEFKARWTALEADATAQRRRASEDHARALARRDAEIADVTANSRVAAAAAAKAVNEAKAQLAERDAAVVRLRAEAAQLAADLAAARQQAAEASAAAEASGKALAAAEGSCAHIAGALRALTVQHERLVATGSKAAEELEQLNIGYGQLLEQVDDMSADQQRLEGECAALKVQLKDEVQRRKEEHKRLEGECAALKVQLSDEMQRRKEEAKHHQEEAAIAASAAAAAIEQAAELRAERDRLNEQIANLEAALLAHKSAAAIAEERAAAERAAAEAAQREVAQQAAVREAALEIERRSRERRTQQQEQALANRQKALEESNREKAALKAHSAEQQAATGRKDFAASLGMMQEAVDSVLAAFLLPQREVRARRAARQRPPGFNLAGSGASVAASGSSVGGSSRGTVRPTPSRPVTPGRARRLAPVPRVASCLGSAPGSPSSPHQPQRHPVEERYAVSEISVSPMSTRSSLWSCTPSGFTAAGEAARSPFAASRPGTSSQAAADDDEGSVRSVESRPPPPTTVPQRWADMDVDPRLSLRSIINLPSGDGSRRPASAGDFGAAAGSPAKFASSPPPRPGSALSATSRGGFPGRASDVGSRGRDTENDMTSELGTQQLDGLGDAGGFGSNAGASGHELLASFSFAPGMLAELRSPTLLSVPLEDTAAAAGAAAAADPPAADKQVVSAAPQHARAPAAAWQHIAASTAAAMAARPPAAPEHVPAPRPSAMGHRRALSAGGIVSSRSAGDADADASLAALAGFARPPVQKKWQRRLTIEVPEPPSE